MKRLQTGEVLRKKAQIIIIIMSKKQSIFSGFVLLKFQSNTVM